MRSVTYCGMRRDEFFHHYVSHDDLAFAPGRSNDICESLQLLAISVEVKIYIEIERLNIYISVVKDVMRIDYILMVLSE